jgi:hypothetical protein
MTKKNLSIEEQVAIIQKTLTNPEFFDEDQAIQAGIKHHKVKRITYKNHYEWSEGLISESAADYE